MTSRMKARFAISMTKRSRPKASPPCGGVPYWNASIMKPNFIMSDFRCKADRLEYLLLEVTVVNTQAAAANLTPFNTIS